MSNGEVHTKRKAKSVWQPTMGRYEQRPKLVRAIAFNKQSIGAFRSMGFLIVVAGPEHPDLVAGEPLWAELKTDSGVLHVRLNNYYVVEANGNQLSVRPKKFERKYRSVE